MLRCVARKGRSLRWRSSTCRSLCVIPLEFATIIDSAEQASEVSKQQQQQAVAATPTPLDPTPSFVERKVEMAGNWSKSSVEFSNYIKRQFYKLFHRLKANEITGFRLHFPPDLSSMYFKVVWKQAGLRCFERTMEGVGAARHLCVSNTVFTSPTEKNLSHQMAKEVYGKKYAHAFKTFDLMRKSQLPASARAFDMLLELNKCDATGAQMVFSSMKRANVTPTLHSYTCLATAYARCGKIEESAKIVFGELKAAEHAVVELIKACAECENTTHLNAVIARMKEARVQPTFFLISAMFDAFGMLGDHASAMALWSNVSSSDDTFADIVAPTECLPTTIFDEPAKPAGPKWEWPGLPWPGVNFSQFISGRNLSDEANPSSSSATTEGEFPQKARFEHGKLEGAVKLYASAVQAFAKLQAVREANEALQALVAIVESLQDVWHDPTLDGKDSVGGVLKSFVQDAVSTAFQVVLQMTTLPIADLKALTSQAKSMGMPVRGRMLVGALWAYRRHTFMTKRGHADGVLLMREAIKDMQSSPRIPRQMEVDAIIAMLACKSTGVELPTEVFPPPPVFPINDPFDYGHKNIYLFQKDKSAGLNLELALEFLILLRNIGYPLTQKNLETLMDPKSHIHPKYSLAQQLMLLLPYFGMQPTIRQWRDFFSTLNFLDPRLNHRLRQAETVLNVYNYFPPVRAATYILRLYLSPNGDFVAGEKWLTRMMEAGYLLEKEFVIDYLKELVKNPNARGVELATSMLAKMERKPDDYMYNLLLEAGAYLGTPIASVALFEKLQYEGVLLDVRGLGLIVATLLKARPNNIVERQLEAILAEMEERGFTSELEIIKKGNICTLFPRLIADEFPADCVMWLPSASDIQVGMFWKQRAAAERAQYLEQMTNMVEREGRDEARLAAEAEYYYNNRENIDDNKFYSPSSSPPPLHDDAPLGRSGGGLQTQSRRPPPNPFEVNIHALDPLPGETAPDSSHKFAFDYRESDPSSSPGSPNKFAFDYRDDQQHNDNQKS